MREKYPALPKTIRLPGGRVKIVQMENITIVDDCGADAACNGLWNQDERTIYIDSTISAEQKWRFFYHELTHAALTEGGMDDMLHSLIAPQLFEAVVEGVCNAVASQRMQEKYG